MTRLEGSVIWFNDAKGYGFIKPENGEPDVFVHFSQIEMDGYKKLKENQRVSYSIGKGPRGRQAEEVRRDMSELIRNGECAGHLAQSKPLCDTTMTPRNPAHLCCCVKRTDEMGPCDTFQVGMGGRCVFCDHEGACHGASEKPRI